jgi:hypothetical protein
MATATRTRRKTKRKTVSKVEAIKSQPEIPEEISAGPITIDALIMSNDEVTGRRVTVDFYPGKPWRYHGRIVYALAERGDKLMVFNPFEHAQPGYSPEDLFDAIDWQVVKTVYQVSKRTLEKLNAGLMLALVGILVFFIFLLFSSITGA